MTTNPVTTCDECGTAKKDVNHWFKVYLGADLCTDNGAWPPVFSLVAWQKGIDGHDICGQQCATKVLQRWMAEGVFLEKDIVKESET